MKLIDLDIHMQSLLHQAPEKRIQDLMALDIKESEGSSRELTFLRTLAYTVIFKEEQIHIHDIPDLLQQNPALLSLPVQKSVSHTPSLGTLILSLLQEYLCTSALAYMASLKQMPYPLSPQARELYWHLQQEYVNGTFSEPEDWVSRLPPTYSNEPATTDQSELLRQVVSDLTGVGLLEWQRLKRKEFPLHTNERWRLIQRYHLATPCKGFWASQHGRDEVSTVKHQFHVS